MDSTLRVASPTSLYSSWSAVPFRAPPSYDGAPFASAPADTASLAEPAYEPESHDASSLFRRSGGIDALQPAADAVIPNTVKWGPKLLIGLQGPYKLSPSPIGTSPSEKRHDPFKFSPQSENMNAPHHIDDLFGKSPFNFVVPEVLSGPKFPGEPMRHRNSFDGRISEIDPEEHETGRQRLGSVDSLGSGIDEGEGMFAMDPLLDSLTDISGDSQSNSSMEAPANTPPPPAMPMPMPVPECPPVTTYGEHPLGEHPSRTLFVRNINSNVEDEELRALFEQYGTIRSMYTQCKHRGFVMISYYDIRHAKNAMRHLQMKVLRRRKLDIHYSIPKDNPSEKDQNQGTLVVFNLDPATTNEELKQTFGQHGEIKEIRETPNKKHHKFIEFYDVRDAERAMKMLNKTEIRGKKIKIEPSRPGGARKGIPQHTSEFYNSDEDFVDPQSYSHYDHSSSLGNHNFPYQMTPFSPSATSYPPVQQVLPKYKPYYASPQNGSMYRLMKPRSTGSVYQPGSPDHSPNANVFHHPNSPQGTLWSPPHHSRGFIHEPHDSPGPDGVVHPTGLSLSPTYFAETDHNHMMQNGVHPRESSPVPEHTRSRRANSEEDKSKFKLIIEDVDKDGRTTLMIKNIPNKYNQKMLLQAVDEHHKGTYDFFYLPIDFKNKCNVGYAFINFTSTQYIRSFYEKFNGKKWEKFNSEKVCVIAYARIQGKQALIQHFQNSSLMCEDKKCRPIIFHSDGPNAGEIEPFPIGANVRMRKNSTNA